MENVRRVIIFSFKCLLDLGGLKPLLSAVVLLISGLIINVDTTGYMMIQERINNFGPLDDQVVKWQKTCSLIREQIISHFKNRYQPEMIFLLGETLYCFYFCFFNFPLVPL